MKLTAIIEKSANRWHERKKVLAFIHILKKITFVIIENPGNMIREK